MARGSGWGLEQPRDPQTRSQGTLGWLGCTPSKEGVAGSPDLGRGASSRHPMERQVQGAGIVDVPQTSLASGLQRLRESSSSGKIDLTTCGSTFWAAGTLRPREGTASSRPEGRSCSRAR